MSDLDRSLDQREPDPVTPTADWGPDWPWWKRWLVGFVGGDPVAATQTAMLSTGGTADERPGLPTGTIVLIGIATFAVLTFIGGSR